VLVTATGLALAIHHDARAIAVLANLGGFLTPVLLSENRDAAVALFAYMAVLDAGLLASAYWRPVARAPRPQSGLHGDGLLGMVPRLVRDGAARGGAGGSQRVLRAVRPGGARQHGGSSTRRPCEPASLGDAGLVPERSYHLLRGRPRRAGRR